MGLLAGKVALRDVRDVDGFVNAALNRTGLILPADEREELEAEGIRILYEMEARWDGRGSFKGYAGCYLADRLVSAWHSLHRGEHVRRRRAGGRREWEYRAPIASFDQLVAA